MKHDIIYALGILPLALFLNTVSAKTASDLGVNQFPEAPEFTNKPAYFLLVFGQESPRMIWAAVDGHKLYLDQDGDQNLRDEKPVLADEESQFKTFEIPQIILKNRGLTKTGLTLRNITIGWNPSVMRSAEGLKFSKDQKTLFLNIHTGKCEQMVVSAAVDLKPAATPASAPAFRFDGKFAFNLALTGTKKNKLKHFTRGKPHNFILQMNSFLGKTRTQVSSNAGSFPENIHPKVEISLPPQGAKAPPIVIRKTLDYRC